MALDYRTAGVDMRRESEAVGALIRRIGFRRHGLGAPVECPGAHFTGLVDLGDYALGICTDGVGSKMLIAEAMHRYDTVGIDCVAMNVNDMVCAGAEPLAFVDYLAMPEPDAEIASEIGVGLSRAAEMANVTVAGGETATLPEMLKGVDLAGASIGIVRKDEIVSGEDVADGDVIVGLPSSGPHSNGYTLIRAAMARAGIACSDPFEGSGYTTVGEALLEPTRIYVRAVMAVLNAVRAAGERVHAIAHITGGGLHNMNRMRAGFRYVIEDPLPPQPIFTQIARWGDVEPAEMYRTFNMGMGMAIVLPPSVRKVVLDVLSRNGLEGQVVGYVEECGGSSSVTVLKGATEMEFEGY